MEVLLKVLFAAIVMVAALLIGLSIRPSGIYQPTEHHQEVYAP